MDMRHVSSFAQMKLVVPSGKKWLVFSSRNVIPCIKNIWNSNWAEFLIQVEKNLRELDG